MDRYSVLLLLLVAPLLLVRVQSGRFRRGYSVLVPKLAILRVLNFENFLIFSPAIGGGIAKLAFYEFVLALCTGCIQQDGDCEHDSTC